MPVDHGTSVLLVRSAGGIHLLVIIIGVEGKTLKNCTSGVS